MTDDDLAAWRRLNPGAPINQPQAQPRYFID